MRTHLLASLLVSLALPLTAPASTLQEARVALHIIPGVQKGDPCDIPGLDQTMACDYPNGSNLNLEGDLLTGRSVMIVVLDVDPAVGLAAVSLGIEWSDPEMFVSAGDLSCADVAFPSPTWPASGSGILVAWNSATNCQNTPDASDPQGQAVGVAYALYTYAYSPAHLQVIQRPQDSVLKVADCNSVESVLNVPDQAGRIIFGTSSETFAFDPCTPYPLPVEPTSWGRLKRMYATDER